MEGIGGVDRDRTDDLLSAISRWEARFAPFSVLRQLTGREELRPIARAIEHADAARRDSSAGRLALERRVDADVQGYVATSAPLAINHLLRTFAGR